MKAASRHTHLSFHAANVPAGADIDDLTRDALVHIGREAVMNAAKHSGAQRVEVDLRYGDSWHLKIRDDGRGFDAQDLSGGFGLRSMQEHATALGGSIRIRSVIGAGTTVEAILP